MTQLRKQIFLTNNGLWSLFLLGVALAFPSLVGANEVNSGKNTEEENIYQTSLLDSLLSMEEVLSVRLEGPWSSMDSLRYTDEYQKATFHLALPNGDSWELDLKVRPRGKYRRKICAFPPLKLNFSDKDLRKQGFNDQFDKFKLVTRCTEDEAGEDLVLREYLAYQMYRELEPEKSFRVKLLNLTFVDTETGALWNGYGFLIEDDKELAARVNATSSDLMNAQPDSLDSGIEAKVALFQYMISNSDWSYGGMRNLQLFRNEDPSAPPYFAVPYDFDFSGLVNAPYAIPLREVGQTSIRERVYMGRMMDNDTLWKGLQVFFMQRDALFKLIEGKSWLSDGSMDDLTQYLGSFYTELRGILKSPPTVVTAAFTQPVPFKNKPQADRVPSGSRWP